MNLDTFLKIQQELDRKLDPPLFKVLKQIQDQNRWATNWDKIIRKISSSAVPNMSSYDFVLQAIEHSDKIKSWTELITKYSIHNDESNSEDKLFYTDYDLYNNIEEKPKLSKILIDESKQIRKIISEIYKQNLTLFSISPREFEEVISELLRKQGFETQLTKQTRDNGFDIIAIQHIAGHYPIKFLVECKRFRLDRPVGVNIIRSFSDVIKSENANRGIIATTSYFSPEATKRELQTPYLLDLRDRVDIISWVEDYMKTLSNY